MLKEPERFRIPTVSGELLEVACNWNEKIKGDYIKLRLAGEEVIVPRSAFSKAAMWLANEEEQDAMIPTKSVPVRILKKTVTIKLNKDMKFGEYISIPVEMKVDLNKVRERGEARIIT